MGSGAVALGVLTSVITRGPGLLADATGCKGIVDKDALKQIADLQNIIKPIP